MHDRGRPRSNPTTRRILLSILLTLSLGATAQALVFDVNAVTDGADLTPGDGLCSTGLTVDDPVLGLVPQCTLRAAIGEANAWPGRDQITFTSALSYNAITGTATFTPASSYPDVTDPADIDGTTAPGWVAGGIPKILISGQSSLNGLELQAGALDSTIQGLAFQGFASGISLMGTAGVWIDACAFGYFNVPIQPGSETVVGNVRGIDVSTGSTGTIVGVKVADQAFVGSGNVIAGNTYGIRNDGTGTSIAGNRIGTDPAGQRINTIAIPPASPIDLGNAYGIHVQNGAGLSIGRKILIVEPLVPIQVLTRGNVVSGNQVAGIWIDEVVGDGAATLLVQANAIGTDIDEEIALPNGIGILFQSSLTPVEIGGALAPNGIAGNTGDGIHLGPDAASVGVVIHFNRIGTGFDEVTAIPNGGHGVHVESGFTVDIVSNVIGHNMGDGIHAEDPDGPAGLLFVGPITIDSNSIGVNSAGQLVPNVGDGIEMVDEEGDITNNIIGGNENGIHLGEDSLDVHVAGNYVGTDTTSADLGNVNAGIRALGNAHVIGDVGLGNVIGWNGTNGIGTQSARFSPVIISNFIGVDVSGSPIPNGRHGIAVRNDVGAVTPVLIGASSLLTPEDFDLTANHVAFNVQDGIAVLDEGHAYIRGNRIMENGDRAIDLGNDGITPNDVGDGDLGPNWLQNHPEITPGISFLDVATGDLVVNYRVPSDHPEASYPLTVDFYLADLDGEEPELFLGTEEIPDTEAGLLRTFVFTPAIPLSPTTHILVATASDARFRTSETSPPIAVPEASPGPAVAVGAALLAWLTRRRAKGRPGTPARLVRPKSP